MQAKTVNKFGEIEISGEVFANLVGSAATGCYGVVGMANRSKTDGIVRLLKKDSLDKGVKVFVGEGFVTVELHIIVEYGVNIPAICRNIMSRVKYFVESTTGFTVRLVNVFVDSMRID